MAEQSTTARPYAKALFSFALEHDAMQQWYHILQALSIIVQSPVMMNIMDNPHYTEQQLKALIIDVVKEAIPMQDTMTSKLDNFISILVQWRRLSALPDIVSQYEWLMQKEQGIKAVDVISAFTLSDLQQQHLQQALEKRFQSKVKIDYECDNTLIGGLIVHVEDWVMDHSIRGQLARLRDSLRG